MARPPWSPTVSGALHLVGGVLGLGLLVLGFGFRLSFGVSAFLVWGFAFRLSVFCFGVEGSHLPAQGWTPWRSWSRLSCPADPASAGSGFGFRV